jgi:hypothetical protein
VELWHGLELLSFSAMEDSVLARSQVQVITARLLPYACPSLRLKAFRAWAVWLSRPSLVDSSSESDFGVGFPDDESEGESSDCSATPDAPSLVDNSSESDFPFGFLDDQAEGESSDCSATSDAASPIADYAAVYNVDELDEVRVCNGRRYECQVCDASCLDKCSGSVLPSMVACRNGFCNVGTNPHVKVNGLCEKFVSALVSDGASKVPCSSRMHRHTWWARVDDFLRIAGACENVDDLARHLVLFDPLVAKWYQCMSQGLHARRAGRARVVAWRRSPGCGVSRRSVRRAASLCMLKKAACWASQPEMGTCTLREYSIADALENAKVVSHGSAFAGYSSKCLQACIVQLLKGRSQEFAWAEFRKDCMNGSCSGYGGSQREAKNFEVARRVLEKTNTFAWVFEASSRSSVDFGRMRGLWQLGATSGACVGIMVWLEEESHVLTVHDSSSLSVLCEQWRAAGLLSSRRVAPWTRYVVGAPKKKSAPRKQPQRGANLRIKKGEAGYVERWSNSMRVEHCRTDGVDYEASWNDQDSLVRVQLKLYRYQEGVETSSMERKPFRHLLETL